MKNKYIYGLVLLVCLASNSTMADNYANPNLVFYGDRPFAPEERQQLRDTYQSVRDGYDNGLQESSRATRVQAMEAYNREAYKEALRLFNVAWWLDKSEARNYLGLFYASHSLDQLEEALYVGETALGIVPDHQDLLGRMAVIYAVYANKPNDHYAQRALYLLKRAENATIPCECQFHNTLQVQVILKDFDGAKKTIIKAEVSGEPLSPTLLNWYENSLARAQG